MLSICSCFDSCIAHVEHAGQDHAATEVGEVEEVNQEEEQQQFVGADQEPESEQDLTNFYNTQGKPRFIYLCITLIYMQAPVHDKPSTIYNWVLQLLLYLCIKFIGVVWYLVAWVGPGSIQIPWYPRWTSIDRNDCFA